MNRNVTIVIIILVLVVIAGYLVWIRSKYQPPISPVVSEQVQTVEPSLSPSPTATPGTKEASGSMKEKSATNSSTKK
jgi:hypothetical protein